MTWCQYLSEGTQLATLTIPLRSLPSTQWWRGFGQHVQGGNDCPYANIVENAAPWIMTVGASGVYRRFSNSVKLGNAIETDVSPFFLFGKVYKVRCFGGD